MDRVSLTRFRVSEVVVAGRRSRDRVQVGSPVAMEPTTLGPLSRPAAELPAAVMLSAEDATGRVGPIPLCPSAPNVIGSDPRCCNIVIGDCHISRRHAQVVCEENGFVIYDLGSTDGTYVNGRCVRIHRLHDGDQVQLGDTTLVFAVRTWYEDGKPAQTPHLLYDRYVAR